MPLPASAFPLSTSGARLLGADGNPVSLGLGVNWGGAQQDEMLPYGLDILPRSQIIGRITGWGMSHVRFPFALGTFVRNDGTRKTGLAKESRLAANPDLIGMTPAGVYRVLAEDMTAAGLYVIPNQHLLHEGWCCSQADCNGIWYNDNWPSSVFTDTWIMVAQWFRDNPRIGYDLHNEPRPATIGGSLRTPAWGSNWAGSYPTDFRDVYQNTIGRLRAVELDISHLMFCEGLAYAGDLSGWGAKPVTGENIVASVHDYPWYHNGQDRAACYAANDAKWGYLLTQGKAPVWVGEFGLSTDMNTAAMQSGWLPDFLAYYGDRQPCGACWWELSATAVLGTEPVTNAVKMAPGGREGFGLMSGQDWLGSQTAVLDMLAPIMSS
jgi:endoglucanase